MKCCYCKKIDHNIVLDGNINKCEWEDAKPITLADTVTGNKPKKETYAKIIYNSEFLYIGFKCSDDGIHASLTEYNSKIYNEEVVEVFIDDNSDLKSYVEIEVSPINTLLHYAIFNNLDGSANVSFARIKKVVKTAIYRQSPKGDWSVEIAVPLSEFVTAPNNPPEKGDEWLINFYRIKRPEGKQDEYSAWSPTGRINFHMPHKFGKLIFT